MIGKILGALIGAEVEKRRQQSGFKGAIIGAAAAGLLRRLGPVGLALGGAYPSVHVSSSDHFSHPFNCGCKQHSNNNQRCEVGEQDNHYNIATKLHNHTTPSAANNSSSSICKLDRQ